MSIVEHEAEVFAAESYQQGYEDAINNQPYNESGCNPSSYHEGWALGKSSNRETKESGWFTGTT